MRFTGEAAGLPEHEQILILRTAAEIGVPATFLAAIRIAENGRKGNEFGVLSDPTIDTLEEECRVAALSIRNNQYRYVARFKEWPVNTSGILSEAFTKFMATRWAPVGATNDPNGLNAHWPKNVFRAHQNSGIW